MSKSKIIESKVIANFENELREKFSELEVIQQGLDSFPIIYKQQISEIHEDRCKIRKIHITDVRNTRMETTIEYQVSTDKGPFWFEIGFKLVPMHTIH